MSSVKPTPVRKPKYGHELLNACYFGNTRDAIKWLDKGADFTYCDPRDGWAGAHYAARFGKISILKRMFESGLDINLRTTGKETLLHKACRTNRADTILWMMKRGANPALLNGDAMKASDLTMDSECKFICDHFEEYMQLKKDNITFAEYHARQSQINSRYTSRASSRGNSKSSSRASSRSNSREGSVCGDNTSPIKYVASDPALDAAVRKMLAPSSHNRDKKHQAGK